MKTLIIKADDFGGSRDAVNTIISLHLKGIITSTSVMAPMPGLEYGIEKLKVDQAAAEFEAQMRKFLDTGLKPANYRELTGMKI